MANTYFISTKRLVTHMLIAVAFVGTSFVLGIQSAGDVTPVRLIEAGGSSIAGDMDSDGALTVNDAIIILEIARGYRDATPEQFGADPNGDYSLTVDDALIILDALRAH